MTRLSYAPYYFAGVTIKGQPRKAVNGNGHKPVATAAASPALAAAAAFPSARRPTAAQISALTSPLIARAEFARTTGYTFDGLRNVDVQLGYEQALTVADYRHRYRRGGVAKRVVDFYPRATWAIDARLTEDADANTDTPFEAAANALFQRLNVWSTFARADIIAGLGHYSVIVIGDGGALDQPLPKRVKDIIYLQIYAEDNAVIQKWETSASSPRFGQPLTYQVNVGAVDLLNTPLIGNRPPSKPVIVHWSRVLHVADGLLENDVYGEPALESVWNYLNDLLKVVGGGAEAAWKRMDPGVSWDMDKEMELDAAEEQLISDQIDEYQHGLRRQMLTRGVKPNVLSTTVAGFGPNASAILELICATKGIPQRVFAGSERGQLASSQDDENARDRVNERRKYFANPLVRQFVDRCIQHGVLPVPKGKQGDDVVPAGKYPYVITWPRVGALDSVKTAEVLSKIAGANQAQSQANGGLILTADEIRHKLLDLGPRPAEAKVVYGKGGAGGEPVSGGADEARGLIVNAMLGLPDDETRPAQLAALLDLAQELQGR